MRPPSGLAIGFARWRSDLPSGGNRYDDELTAGLRELGIDVREHPITGSWPLPSEGDRNRLPQVLAAEEDWLIGNIVASAAPEQIEAATAAGTGITLLMHYFPADDPGLAPRDRELLAAGEARAVTAASAVVVTSAWAKGEVAGRYGRRDAIVAVPGVRPAPFAPGSPVAGVPALLWLGRLSAGKDPLTFLKALLEVRELPWSARIAGPAAEQPVHRELRERIRRSGLTGRVELPGPLEGPALERAWAGTDLLVHTSRHETYGMVLTEALARGIPAIVAGGTGAVDAHRAGATFPAGDPGALAARLRSWLTDADLRARWHREAARARTHLPTWAATAEAVAAALVIHRHG